MTQNKNQLIDILIGNLTNAIVHTILEKSIDKQELVSKYRNEVINSYSIAKRYREKINPIDRCLPTVDLNYIKEKLKTKIKVELCLRINKGYQNINLDLVDIEIDNALKLLNIT
jgi:spore germination protein YaaH